MSGVAHLEDLDIVEVKECLAAGCQADMAESECARLREEVARLRRNIARSVDDFRMRAMGQASTRAEVLNSAAATMERIIASPSPTGAEET